MVMLILLALYVQYDAYKAFNKAEASTVKIDFQEFSNRVIESRTLSVIMNLEKEDYKNQKVIECAAGVAGSLGSMGKTVNNYAISDLGTTERYNNPVMGIIAVVIGIMFLGYLGINRSELGNKRNEVFLFLVLLLVSVLVAIFHTDAIKTGGICVKPNVEKDSIERCMTAIGSTYYFDVSYGKSSTVFYENRAEINVDKTFTGDCSIVVSGNE